jgi:hypothetical protein
VLADSLVLRIPLLRQAPNRYLQPLDDTTNFEQLNIEPTDETLILKNKINNK